MYVPIRVIRLRVKIRILINAARALRPVTILNIDLKRPLTNFESSLTQSSLVRSPRITFSKSRYRWSQHRYADALSSMRRCIYMPYNIVIQTPVVRECIRSLVKRSHYGRSLMQNNRVDQCPGNITKYYTADNEVTEPRLSRELHENLR